MPKRVGQSAGTAGNIGRKKVVLNPKGPLAGLRKHRQAMEMGDPAAGKVTIGEQTRSQVIKNGKVKNFK